MGPLSSGYGGKFPRHRWANKWGVKRAIIFSSLLFGVLHVEGTLEGTLGAFVFGVVMAILYLRTRTLLIPIACHMLNNAVAVAIGIWGVGWGDPTSLEDFQSMLWIAVVGLAIATPILFLYIYRAWGTLTGGLPYFDSQMFPPRNPRSRPGGDDREVGKPGRVPLPWESPSVHGSWVDSRSDVYLALTGDKSVDKWARKS